MFRGKEIPLGARIIAVVDAYDAMTRDRPYRRQLSPAIALERQRDGAGTQFDPFVVGKLIEYLPRVNTRRTSESQTLNCRMISFRPSNR